MHTGHRRWGLPRHFWHHFHGCGPDSGDGPRGERGHGSSRGGRGRGGPLGGRRPMRFLARRLGLTDDQFDAVHRALSDLKTERAQAAVDARRAARSFGDAVAGEQFDTDAAKAGAGERSASADKLSAALTETLRRIHAVLDPEQRQAFAMLIREMPPWLL